MRSLPCTFSQTYASMLNNTKSSSLWSSQGMHLILLPWCSSWLLELSFPPVWPELPCPALLGLPPPPSPLCFEPELLPPLASWPADPAPLPVLSLEESCLSLVVALSFYNRCELKISTTEYSAFISLSIPKDSGCSQGSQVRVQHCFRFLLSRQQAVMQINAMLILSSVS